MPKKLPCNDSLKKVSLSSSVVVLRDEFGEVLTAFPAKEITYLSFVEGNEYIDDQAYIYLTNGRVEVFRMSRAQFNRLYSILWGNFKVYAFDRGE